jgi:hypothetical protein
VPAAAQVAPIAAATLASRFAEMLFGRVVRISPWRTADSEAADEPLRIAGAQNAAISDFHFI